ncbi:Dehydrogenase azaJ [Hypsizygus marmoreus]|uniref:Dehydrogenase azaJ n=1 Tax=Hypsizygus marmoreus TaxID=39966 RepID=A0A369K8X0_HYPMA|nr:Dehydrogenase azaJ [Hypsizygus marmoreus]
MQSAPRRRVSHPAIASSCTAMIMRAGDTRFSRFQRYVLTKQEMTSHIGDTPFESASTAASTAGNAVSALHLHLGLDRPSPNLQPTTQSIAQGRNRPCMEWCLIHRLIRHSGGITGTVEYNLPGSQHVLSVPPPKAGYRVVTTASSKHTSYLQSLGASAVIDYTLPSTTLLSTLQSHGPYYRTFSAASQVVLGDLVSAQGGGSFLATMGVRPGVVLPPAVEGFFAQYLDDFLKPVHGEFTRWFYWEWLETAIRTGSLRLARVEVLPGGLEAIESGLRKLEKGVSSLKLIVDPSA